MRPADPQQEERFGNHRDSEHHGHGDETSNIPRFWFSGWPNIIRGEGDLREVRHKGQEQHCKGGNDELTGYYICDGYKSRLQDRPADFVAVPYVVTGKFVVSAFAMLL